MTGMMVDRASASCRAGCDMPGPDDPCGCDTLTIYDVGAFMMNMIGRYLASGGTAISAYPCQSRDDCPDIPPPPQPRDPSELR